MAAEGKAKHENLMFLPELDHFPPILSSFKKGWGLELPPDLCPPISLKHLQCGAVSEPPPGYSSGILGLVPYPQVGSAVFPTHPAAQHPIYLEGLRLHPLLPSSDLASLGPPNHFLG